MENAYYDGTKILSLQDINGKKPELYLISTNRSGGKTTYFGRLLVNRFLKQGKKFMILYRTKYEIEDAAEKFFKEIGNLFFSNCGMTQKVHKPIYTELFINDVPCGYAAALNAADQIKKYSHLFSDTDCILFDEFQPETNIYVPNELTKFMSIHTSVARGGGKQYRYVPVYMISNPITLINPYYVALGISNRLTKQTHFLRGNGFVVEQGYIDAAKRAQEESGFNKAFSSDSYMSYQKDGVYLLDDMVFIEKPEGRQRYYVTIKYHDSYYGIREYPDLGLYYVDNKPDMSFPVKLAVTTKDMDINYICLRNNKATFDHLRYFFHLGCFRFKDLKCKEALFTSLSY